MYIKNDDNIIDYLTEERNAISKLKTKEIMNVFNLLEDCLCDSRRVFVFGNGGSGSTASHIAGDFNKALFEKTNNRFNFICLNDNIPTMMAIANDEDYDEIFRYQLCGRLNTQDVVIAISGSGNSKNIINAVEYAKEIGSTVVGFTGFNGGKLKQLADYSINTNINNMQITEDIHLMIEHLLINLFYNMYGLKQDNFKKILERKNIYE